MNNEQVSKLQEILAQMTALTAGGDPEAEHGEADNLLIQTIHLLTTPEMEELISQIIEQYEEVEKWYA